MKAMPGPVAKTIRCAIYTRKSSDEGLEQAFNSLDAQREACAAYIASQASEGWVLCPEVYDDGGLSGGTLERPALQRLLAEVAARRVDIIVVYKVDRLTRSLFDFAKLVETFDAAGTSFVSVTQSFNTTTSMGRLTLNMLLSFAQFEREVTAERIRDKIAASKARGMWMGGTPPLGYAPEGRTLAIVDEHASIIRRIYGRYLALRNVRLLADELAEHGIVNPVRTRGGSGSNYGGKPFQRGQLYAILRNPIYIGRIAHGTRTHAGIHTAIIDMATWDAVQALLADNRQGEGAKVRAATPSLLAGRVVDQHGEPLIASHASKAGRRYRYYVSRTLQNNSASCGTRIPALELEALVTERLAQAFDDPFALAGSASLSLTPASAALLTDRGTAIAGKLRERQRATVQAMVDTIRVHPDRIIIQCSTDAIAAALQLDAAADTPAMVMLTAKVALTRTGRAMRLVQDSGAAAQRIANPSLIKLLLKARRWWAMVREGELDIKQLAAREGVQASYVTRVVRLAFLSPAVVDAIIKGNVRGDIDVAALTATDSIPACWQTQGLAILPMTAVG